MPTASLSSKHLDYLMVEDFIRSLGFDAFPEGFPPQLKALVPTGHTATVRRLFELRFVEKMTNLQLAAMESEREALDQDHPSVVAIAKFFADAILRVGMGREEW